jgi:cellulose synthase/poly-beta-1,6-N-acetylglucosamine synthase-like glycosyltransferase
MSHTWIIPYGGENRSVTALTEAVISCGRPTKTNQVVVVDDTEKAEIGNALMFLGIQIVRNEGEHSCAHALNRGLQEVQTEWVYRMDSDDTSAISNDRDYLCKKADPEVVCICGDIQTQIGQVQVLKWKNHEECTKLLSLHRNPIFHPATCIRTSALRKVGGWPLCSPVEDYALWCKLAKIGKFLPSTHIWTNYHLRGGSTRQHLVDEIAIANGW